MKANMKERIKKIGETAYYGFVDTEFGKEWLIGMMVDPYPHDFWQGIEPPSEEEARLAFQYLKDAGLIIADVTELGTKRCPDLKEDHFMFISTEFYPRRTAKTREFRKTQEYKDWLKK
jgi:hypothetical protein